MIAWLTESHYPVWGESTVLVSQIASPGKHQNPKFKVSTKCPSLLPHHKLEPSGWGSSVVLNIHIQKNCSYQMKTHTQHIHKLPISRKILQYILKYEEGRSYFEIPTSLWTQPNNGMWNTGIST